jgi:hypothetical protein
MTISDIKDSLEKNNNNIPVDDNILSCILYTYQGYWLAKYKRPLFKTTFFIKNNGFDPFLKLVFPFENESLFNIEDEPEFNDFFNNSINHLLSIDYFYYLNHYSKTNSAYVNTEDFQVISNHAIEQEFNNQSNRLLL